MSKRYFAKSITIGEETKLYVCDTRLNIGDTVIHKKTYEEVVYSEEHKTNMNHWGNYCKILKIVSPHATWVKAGDEFDESDIQFCGVSHKPPMQHLDYSFCKIKGPCGHFH